MCATVSEIQIFSNIDLFYYMNIFICIHKTRVMSDICLELFPFGIPSSFLHHRNLNKPYLNFCPLVSLLFLLENVFLSTIHGGTRKTRFQCNNCFPILYMNAKVIGYLKLLCARRTKMETWFWAVFWFRRNFFTQLFPCMPWINAIHYSYMNLI